MFISSCAPSLCKPVFKGDFYLWVCNIWYQSLLIHLKYHHISSNQTHPCQHQNPHPASTVINTNTTEYFQTHNTLTLGPSTKYHKPKKKKKIVPTIIQNPIHITYQAIYTSFHIQLQKKKKKNPPHQAIMSTTQRKFIEIPKFKDGDPFSWLF